MFKEIIENAILESNIEAEQEIDRKLATLTEICRKIGQKWEEQAGGSAVYYLYKHPTTKNISLQIGDVRFPQSFKAIIRSTIRENQVYAYVLDKDLLVLDEVQTEEKKEDNSTLRNIANSINAPLKEVINAVKRSTDKAIEEELNAKKDKLKIKEVVGEVNIAKKMEDDVDVKIDIYPETMFSNRKVLITEHTILEDVEALLTYDVNINQIKSIVNFLVKKDKEIVIEARLEHSFGFVKIAVDDCLKVFKGLSEKDTKHYTFYGKDNYIINIGNVMFKLTSPKEDKSYMLSNKSKAYCANIFR